MTGTGTVLGTCFPAVDELDHVAEVQQDHCKLVSLLLFSRVVSVVLLHQWPLLEPGLIKALVVSGDLPVACWARYRLSGEQALFLLDALILYEAEHQDVEQFLAGHIFHTFPPELVVVNFDVFQQSELQELAIHSGKIKLGLQIPGN